MAVRPPMEKVDSARPEWLPDGQSSSAAPKSAAPAKSVPWRTPGPAKPAAAARPPKPVKAGRQRHPLERIVPLLFILAFVLVVGGYLAGWHLG